MGQYHKLYNVDKKEYVHGHHLDNRIKLMEQVGFEKSTAPEEEWEITSRARIEDNGR